MSTDSLFSRHERYFESNRFVYPVLSRRSGGISVGINLNPSKLCNFRCIYCQVDRVAQSETRFVDLRQMLEELARTLDLITSGKIYSTEKFRDTLPSMRRLSDIAFSGDGEPTMNRNLPDVVKATANVKKGRQLSQVPLVLITNASLLHREHVREALRVLDENEGEIWAKLDAGSASYFQQVNRTRVDFETVVQNITRAARERPLVIQSLFMRLNGHPPSGDERHAYCDRLREIVAAGGQLKLIQIHTVARIPAESCVSPMSDEEVDELVDFVRANTGLNVAGFHGTRGLR